jgi:membrane-associated protein
VLCYNPALAATRGKPVDIINSAIDFVLHLDQYLNEIIQSYGAWTYALLFLIIFMETGFVVTPFLPGDSLLFAAGTIAALGSLNVWLLFGLLFFAAVLGDTVNYWIGNKVGPRAFEMDIRFMKREYLERTQHFYEKHGGKTIILARFVPIVRTFAPFVAGVGTMNYGRFLSFNIIGAFLWTSIFIFLGYFFGNIPFVKQNFELVIIGIVLVSVVPMVIEYVRGRARKAEFTSATLSQQNPRPGGTHGQQKQTN